MSKHKLIIALVVVAVSLGGWATLRNVDAPPPVGVATAPGTGGFIATTGDPDDPAVQAAAKALGDPATGSSQAGLVSEPSPVPGGGVMIDLQGRFRSTAVATLADSDSVVVECLPDSAPGGLR